MTKYIIKGSMLFPTQDANLVTIDKLEPRNYTVEFDMEQGFYLQKAEAFSNPSKIYGNVLEQTERFVTTFMDRTKNTGILLAGDKGSGKTLLSREVCMFAARKFGVPTLIVNTGFHGNGFNTFISQIDQKVIVLFDEFEKTYKREGDGDAQEKVLTLFDGTISSNTMYLLTVNDTSKISEHMYNRPGRIFYRLDFGTLHETVMKDYVRDNLKDESKHEPTITALGYFETLNFDMVAALVEEMNRYGGTAKDALTIMNIRKETSYRRYVIELYKNDELIISKDDYQSFYHDFEGNDDDDDSFSVGVYVDRSRLIGQDKVEALEHLGRNIPKPTSALDEEDCSDETVQRSNEQDHQDIKALLRNELASFTKQQSGVRDRINITCKWTHFVSNESNAHRYVFLDPDTNVRVVLTYEKAKGYNAHFGYGAGSSN